MITLKIGCKCMYKHDHGPSNNKKVTRERRDLHFCRNPFKALSGENVSVKEWKASWCNKKLHKSVGRIFKFNTPATTVTSVLL